jgi:galactosylceramidase
MRHDSSQYSWSISSSYNISEQTVTFQLDNSFGHITQLFVFFSNLSTLDMDQTFIYKGILTLNSGSFTLPLSVGILYTVSTINGTKGVYKAPPSMPFPLPYQDDFNTYPISNEAAYFVDQTGAWEIIDALSTHNK